MLNVALVPTVLGCLTLLVPAPPDVPADPNSKGYLGVQIRADIQTSGIVVVDVVAEGPADRAGLQVGDLVLKAGSYEPKDTDDLIRHVASHRPGQYLLLSIQRDDEKRTVKVKLGRRPEDLQPVPGSPPAPAATPRKEK
jgi:S1-C subfamily serine protease